MSLNYGIHVLIYTVDSALGGIPKCDWLLIFSLSNAIQSLV